MIYIYLQIKANHKVITQDIYTKIISITYKFIHVHLKKPEDRHIRVVFYFYKTYS